jgi:uncharacterized protein YfaP (DUF2135 family)
MTWRVLFVLAIAAPAAGQVPDQSMTAPIGGWNRAGATDGSDQPTLNYPSSLIFRGAQRGRRMIEGHLEQAGKTRSSATLVVNGNPTPLQTDDTGRYARAYSFGSGSNSVEVRGADGKPKRRVQFYEADRSRPQPVIRVIAGWDDSQAEVDLHVVTPDGQHAFFASPTLSNGGGLDADTVDGPGPENFVMTSPMRGTYQVWINYWGNFSDSGYHFDASTRQRPVITSRITLVFYENTARERREEFLIPLRAIGELTLVKTFTY